MRLVINGDDFGLTKGVTYGILEAHNKGILTSTTALVNQPFFVEAMNLAQNYPNLGVGVHLNLTVGKPLTDVESLIDAATGMFYRKPEIVFSHEVDYDEIYQEWKCQIDTFIKLSKRYPDHLDSHHFSSDYNDQTKEILKQLCKEYDLPARLDGTYYFSRDFYNDTVSAETLMEIIKTNLNRNIEIMVHPGWCDLELYHKSSYSFKRVEELDILCGEQIKNFIKNHNIELVHY